MLDMVCVARPSTAGTVCSTVGQSKVHAGCGAHTRQVLYAGSRTVPNWAHRPAPCIGASAQGQAGTGTSCKAHPVPAQHTSSRLGLAHTAQNIQGWVGLGHALHEVPMVDQPCVLALVHGTSLWL